MVRVRVGSLSGAEKPASGKQDKLKGLNVKQENNIKDV